MEKCALCLERDANDTGSHIVPHFLLKRIFNVEDAKGRDQELSFKLTEFDVETHFGRSVSPEKLDEVFGELSDAELEEKAMAQMVVNNEWCTVCEKKFADLESRYSDTLKTKSEENYQSTNQPSVSFIFWLSIFWRASQTDHVSFKLKYNDQKIARALLNEYDINGSDEDLTSKYSHILENISYKIYRSPDYSSKRGTFLFMAHQSQPYSFIIDEFVVQFYFRVKHMKNNTQLFFGFEKIKDTPLNKFQNGEFVYSLSVEDFGALMDNFVKYYQNIRVRSYDWALDRLHRKAGLRGTMDRKIKEEILHQVSAEQTKIGRKYTKEDFVRSTTSVFKKYGLIS